MKADFFALKLDALANVNSVTAAELNIPKAVNAIAKISYSALHVMVGILLWRL